MEPDASLSWLALTPGLASRLSARLLKECGSPEEVFRAPLPNLDPCRLPAMGGAGGTPEAIVQARGKRAGIDPAHRPLPSGQLDRARIPASLLQIYDPPVLLYVRGSVEVLVQPSIGNVGTRRPTLCGTQMAERLGREIAARGLVVRGMARGVDAISHQGAKAVNGRAIGVLSTGVDVCYPKEN
jgi:DNA processing protein